MICATLYSLRSFAASFSYVSFEGFLKDLSDPEELSLQGSRIIVAEGLQEVEARKITPSQLRNILKAKRVHKQFQIDIKSLNIHQLFQYAAFAFLTHKIVIITDRWTPDLATITRDNVAKIGTY